MAVPLAFPQVELVGEVVTLNGAGGCVIFADNVAVQLFASLTVTV